MESDLRDATNVLHRLFGRGSWIHWPLICTPSGFHFIFIDAERLIFFCLKEYLALFLQGVWTRRYVTGTPCLPSVLLAQGRPHCKCLAVFLAVRPKEKIG